jgi:hypothetical protein
VVCWGKGRQQFLDVVLSLDEARYWVVVFAYVGVFPTEVQEPAHVFLGQHVGIHDADA